MTDYLNCTNQQPPTYSGVTINITNPAMNIPPQYPPMPPEMFYNSYNQPYQAQNPYYNAQITPPDRSQYINKGEYLEPVSDLNSDYNKSLNTSDIKEEAQELNQSKEISQSKEMVSYPQQYYINNYAQNPEQPSSEQALTIKVEQDGNSDTKTSSLENASSNTVPDKNTEDNVQNNLLAPVSGKENNTTPVKVDESSVDNEEVSDMETSKEIIKELDERNAEEKMLEKNGKKTTIVSLTNEYIMSLENYLNNPNTDIRLMAAKEILTRLDEDRNRYDDAALNALLNKMLQDPNKLVRIAALSAFSSELASGNDFTVQLLTQIQQNPEADPEDVLEASQILLKRAAVTEIRYVPVPNQENNGET